MVIVIPYSAFLGLYRPKRDSILPREYLSVFLFTERYIFANHTILIYLISLYLNTTLINFSLNTTLINFSLIKFINEQCLKNDTFCLTKE